MDGLRDRPRASTARPPVVRKIPPPPSPPDPKAAKPHPTLRLRLLFHRVSFRNGERGTTAHPMIVSCVISELKAVGNSKEQRAKERSGRVHFIGFFRLIDHFTILPSGKFDGSSTDAGRS